MGTKKSKVDTSALFRGIVGHDESEAPEVNSGEAEAAAKLPGITMQWQRRASGCVQISVF